MKIDNFTEVNKKIIEHTPLFNRAVKTFENPDNKNKIAGFSRCKPVSYICDFEGKILLIDASSSKHKTQSKTENKKSILDVIHQEDHHFVIEHLVDLLQEKNESVVFEARFLCENNQYVYRKWHVGFLCDLFFFYPINSSVIHFNASKKASSRQTDNVHLNH